MPGPFGQQQQQQQRVQLRMKTYPVLTVQIRTMRGLNERMVGTHWAQRNRKAKVEKAAVGWLLREYHGKYGRPDFPCSVMLTRCGPTPGLDGDNLQGALKYVRDEVAAWLGVDDAWEHLVKWRYAQRRTKLWAVEIEFQPHQEPMSAEGQTES